MPSVPPAAFTPPQQPSGLTRTVAMLRGCVMPHLYPRTHAATVRVLNRLGYRVIFPADEVCCGALSLHAGDRRLARELARRNIDAFLDAGVEAIVVNSAGCGSTMKEYGELLARRCGLSRARSEVRRDDAGRAGVRRARTTCRRSARSTQSVTYQDSCHLVHAQKVTAAPRALMRAIPGLELRELSAPDRCCGSAGLYSLVQREMSGGCSPRRWTTSQATGAAVDRDGEPRLHDADRIRRAAARHATRASSTSSNCSMNRCALVSDPA